MRRSHLLSFGAAGAIAFSTLIVTAPGAGATPFGDACPIVGGWLAEVPTAFLEECHWQDPDGNEHMITNPMTVLPNRSRPIDPGQLAPAG
jgi:hypothetical protein